MKSKIILFYIFLFFSLFITKLTYGQEKNNYYYFNGEKFEIEIDYTTISVTSEEQNIIELLRSPETQFKLKCETPDHARSTVIPIDKSARQRQNKMTSTTFELELEKELSFAAYQKLLENLQKEQKVIMVSPAYKVNGGKMGVSNNFYVKLRSEHDINALYDLAERYSMEILGYDEFMPLWVTVSCGRNTGYNAVEAANIFHETNIFECVEPEFLYHDLSTSNDPEFRYQWGLKNIGQYCNHTRNIDIKAEQAWQITTGSPNIKVAIFDHGFEMDHPDLRSNVHGLGYDAKNGRPPSVVRGNHGTACAGIVGATQNNSLGVSGVAPNSKLISISINLQFSDTPQELARGFNWAGQNGIDIISNSWGGYSPSQYIIDGINNALNQGRGGKGCVVVFASGNENNTAIRYPGNSLPAILVVGAMSPAGERKSPSSCDGENWGSCYGTALDVVAPGVFIPTTDRQGSLGYGSGDYVTNFNGTSSACPHVAGVAALILSVNPRLTGKEVTDIIEKTAQKIGGYTYGKAFGRSFNGSWNQEMGHGLVNAFEAVKLAQKYRCAESLQLTVPITANGEYNASNTITASSSISDNLNVSLKGSTILLRPGFSVKSGILHAVSDPCIPTVATGEIIIDHDYYTTAIDQEMPDENTAASPYEIISSSQNSSSGIEVYPNPADDHLYIIHADNSQIFIYDVTGRCVLQTSINESYSYKMDISHLKSGYYTLSIFKDKEIRENFKIIVQ